MVASKLIVPLALLVLLMSDGDHKFVYVLLRLGFGINKYSTEVQITTVLTLRTLSEHFAIRSPLLPLRFR